MSKCCSTAFQEAFCRDFLQSVALGVIDVYAFVPEGLAALIGSPHNLDALPVVRAKALDERLEQLGSKYGYEVNVNLNSTKNWRCVTVRSGETVLVAASSPRSSFFPRDSIFRKELATANGNPVRNYDLFFDSLEVDGLPNGCLGVLTHYSDSSDFRLPGHAHIVFPSSDWKSEVAPPLDLFACFGISPGYSVSAEDQERIEEKFSITLRQKKQRGSGT